MRVLIYSQIADSTASLMRDFQSSPIASLSPQRRTEWEKAWRKYNARLAEQNPDQLRPALPWRTWDLTGYRFEWLPEAERPCFIHTLFSTKCWWYRLGCLLDGRSDAFIVRCENPESHWIAEDIEGRVLH